MNITKAMLYSAIKDYKTNLLKAEEERFEKTIKPLEKGLNKEFESHKIYNAIEVLFMAVKNLDDTLHRHGLDKCKVLSYYDVHSRTTVYDLKSLFGDAREGTFTNILDDEYIEEEFHEISNSIEQAYIAHNSIKDNIDDFYIRLYNIIKRSKPNDAYKKLIELGVPINLPKYEEAEESDTEVTLEDIAKELNSLLEGDK